MNRRTSLPGGLNSCERIRPERPRNPIQKLIWSPNSQFQINYVGILENEGSNPRMALRRLLRLYEGRQFREAAAFLMKLPQYTLKTALPDIPVDLLIETLPHSLTLLEALYCRLVELNVTDTKILRVEQVLWKVVQLLSNNQDHARPRIWCKLLTYLNRLSPNTKNILASRKKAIERAVEGLGKHGLVPSSLEGSTNTTNSNLVPLPVVLKEQLEARIDAYKLAVHKLESFGKNTGVHKVDQGVQAASHQRQLSLKYSEVQQRLIDNQSLLNTLEKAGNPYNLESLLVELKRRIEHDKEALRQWTALRKSIDLAGTKNPTLAANLLQFSKGCSLTLQLICDGGSSMEKIYSSPIHFENDYEEESCSTGYHTDESRTPEPVVVVANKRHEVFNREKSSQVLISGDLPVERLSKRYSMLYAQAHLHTLDALDTLRPLNDAPELKAKILYSVVVLSWRLAGMVQTYRRLEALNILNGTTTSVPSVANIEECIIRQLATSGAQSGVEEVAEQVINQLERTLYDLPCLKECTEIKRYASMCAGLAWVCLARNTPLVLDVAQDIEFRKEVHLRHHSSSNPNGTRIKSVLWPGLREGYQGSCLHKAVVITV
ncbi:uncharacterized protein LOC118441395 isoform X1 [Vespa mandarinia]|uniref:uncharacterized protein LOC118441395 isoform X1 n=1 Tax=Vespa mandarinia TaxID=7446 RepID=UPI0016121F29|nr:uncharacterized protein LOC118441395 isoform X1 [Vespa mandarinia]